MLKKIPEIKIEGLFKEENQCIQSFSSAKSLKQNSKFERKHKIITKKTKKIEQNKLRSKKTPKIINTFVTCIISGKNNEILIETQISDQKNQNVNTSENSSIEKAKKLATQHKKDILQLKYNIQNIIQKINQSLDNRTQISIQHGNQYLKYLNSLNYLNLNHQLIEFPYPKLRQQVINPNFQSLYLY